MSNATDGLRSQSKVPAPWRVGVLGALLGLLVPLVTIGCLALLDTFVIYPLERGRPLFSSDVTWDFESIGFVSLAFLFSVLALWIFSALPGAVGGVLIGLVLVVTARYRHPRVGTSIAMGAIFGIAAGFLTALLMNLSGDPSAQWSPRVDPILAGAIGAFAGLIHGYLVDRWLRGRIT